MNNLVYLATVGPWAERWENFSGIGIQTALLGILAVFAVLAILWGCLEIFRYVFYTLPNRSNEPDSYKEEVPADEFNELTTASIAEAASDDGEIVAAIIAAITAMRADEAGESGVAPGAFRVVSFRRR